MPRTWMSKATLGMLVAGAIVATAEGVARLVTNEVDWLFAWEHPDGLIRVLGDQVYVREQVHHEMNDGPYSWTVTTNALGLRETADFPKEIPAGTSRVLALGDSWVFGTSVTQEHTISDGLEEVLGEQWNQPVEVINAGIPGASAFEMLVRFTEMQMHMDFDHLVFGLPHNIHRQRDFSKQRATLTAEGDGAPYINVRLYLVFRRLAARWTREPYAQSDQTADGIDGSTLHDITTMVVKAQADGITVWGIEWPHNMKYALNTVNPPATQWRNTLQPYDIVFSGHALNTRSCWGYEDHGHPSEAGARAIAEVVGHVMTGTSRPSGLVTSPRCDEVPGVGPGKPDDPADGEPTP